MNLICRLWDWYCRVTGYTAALEREEGLRIQSTVYPESDR